MLVKALGCGPGVPPGVEPFGCIPGQDRPVGGCSSPGASAAPRRRDSTGFKAAGRRRLPLPGCRACVRVPVCPCARVWQLGTRTHPLPFLCPPLPVPPPLPPQHPSLGCPAARSPAAPELSSSSSSPQLPGFQMCPGRAGASLHTCTRTHAHAQPRREAPLCSCLPPPQTPPVRGRPLRSAPSSPAPPPPQGFAAPTPNGADGEEQNAPPGSWVGGEEVQSPRCPSRTPPSTPCSLLYPLFCIPCKARHRRGCKLGAGRGVQRGLSTAYTPSSWPLGGERHQGCSIPPGHPPC